MTAEEASRTSPTRSADPACAQATGSCTKRAKTARRKDTSITLDNKRRCQSSFLYDFIHSKSCNEWWGSLRCRFAPKIDDCAEPVLGCLCLCIRSSDLRAASSKLSRQVRSPHGRGAEP